MVRPIHVPGRELEPSHHCRVFREERQADLFAALCLIPDVFEKKEDLRGQIGGIAPEFTAVLGADKQAQDVGFEPVSLEFGVGQRFVADWDIFGGIAYFGS